jgi:hypothetical protein
MLKVLFLFVLITVIGFVFYLYLIQQEIEDKG